MFNGGIIGESKQETLSALARSNESWIAPNILIEEDDIGRRMARLREGLALVGPEFPIVLKPDVAQRGQRIQGG
jgi:hypothetical protein